MAGRTKSLAPDPVETVDEEEAPKYPLTIVVHTTSREEFKVDMGVVNDEQMNTVRSIVDGAYMTLKANKGWTLTDSRGVEYCFNSDHIVTIELRLARH